MRDEERYYYPPEPTAYEEAAQDADNLVAEWAAHEFETWIQPYPAERGDGAVLVLNRVAHDGEELFEGSEFFDSIDDLRAYMEERFPWPPPAG